MISILPITAAQTWPLRHAILRPHQPLSEARFPGDDDPSTQHFGAVDAGTVVGIASIFAEALPDRPGPAWRLRGMAVHPDYRRQGLGALLVKACAEQGQRKPGEVLWCNAREVALSFYHGLGFKTLSGPFDLPGIGPHFLLVLPS